MSDILVRAIAKDAGLRGIACATLDLTREAARRHAAYPVSAAALGYGLTAGALLGALLKVQERVALKVEGNGRLRKIVVEADAYGRVRGYVAVPDAVSPQPVDRAAVSEAVGHGMLTVVKDLRLKDLYRSVVALESGELDRELMYYFNTSEQIPSTVALGVELGREAQVVAAGGFLLQLLPGGDPALVDRLERRLAELPPTTTLLRQGVAPAIILERLLGEMPTIHLGRIPLSFTCGCSPEQVAGVLRLLGGTELDHLLADPGEVTVTCEFCKEPYHFDRTELQAIRDGIR